MFAGKVRGRGHSHERTVSARGALLAAVLVALSIGDVSGQLAAPESPDQIAEFEWSEEQVATLRSFLERVDVEEVLADVPLPVARLQDYDVQALATGLSGGWEAPFRFVQRAIAFVPYIGSVRGARGTLLAGAGNSLDQSLLLASLYEARGIRTRLVRGRLRWQQAVQLVGDSHSERTTRGDPWLRWVETAADHWWIDAWRDSQWVALDPSFDGAPGHSSGRGGQAVGSLTDSLVSTATIEVLERGVPVTSARFATSELIGTPVQLFLRKQSPGVLTVQAEETGATPLPPLDPPVRAASIDAQKASRTDPLEAVMPRLAEGPVVLVLEVGGRRLDAGPFERSQLGNVSMRIEVEVPMGPTTVMELPWGNRLEARLGVVFGAGRVQRSLLARESLQIHALLQELAAAEVAALEAFEARPGPNDEEPQLGLAPGVLPTPMPEGPLDEAPLHPVDELHVAVVRAWVGFESRALGVLGVALLAATDELRGPLGMIRPGVRLVGMSWQAPDADRAGNLAVWVHDPVAIGGLDPARRRGVHSAYGLLRSAILGHVLNSVADLPPETAFDVTLRTVGSGRRLGWWTPGSDGPSEWHEVARVAALRDLRSGHTVIGPPEPVRRDEQALLGWWALLPESGATVGRVAVAMGAAQGRVDFVEAHDRADLETVLATLRDLHRASRWLIRVGDAGSGALETLTPRACAATSLVGELLLAGAPGNWQPPMFGDFCGGAAPVGTFAR